MTFSLTLIRSARLAAALAAALLAPSFGADIGQLKWSFATGGPVRSSPALGRDGTVHIGSEDHKVYALGGTTGAQKWVVATGGAVRSSPAVGADGTVYVGSWDGSVYALNGATGTQKWAFAMTTQIESSPAVGADGTVYVGSSEWDAGRLYALDGVTGAQRWVTVLGGSIESSPAVGLDGTVYVASCIGDTFVYALDGVTGAQQWAFATAACVASSPAIGADGTIYFGDSSPKIYALDGATGARKWAFVAMNSVFSSPAIGADGTVYIGCTESKVYALDGATGAMKWTFVANGPVWSSSPAVAADGTVYVGSWDKKLYALDGATGASKWAFATGGEVQSSPAIGADGTVYVGSNDGKVYALQGSAGLADSPWPKFRQNARNTGQRAVAPVVLRQPSRVVLHEGATGKILVKVAGEPVPAFQWHFNGEPIPGATEVTLTLLAITRAAEGIHTVVASNAVGQVTSQPILALVSNVDPLSFPGLKWEGTDAGPVILEATAQLGETVAWHSISNYPPSATTQVYVELDPADAARFYRLNGADRADTLRAGFITGWWFTQPAGTTHQIEYVSAAAGWTNWQVLTNLTLPASPHLFLDTEAFDHPGGVYRTTPGQ